MSHAIPARRRLVSIAVATAVLAVVLGATSAAFAAGSWSLRVASTPYTLNGVNFFDSNNGLAVGANGVLRRTKDGGATWSSQSITGNPTDTFEAVTFVDNSATAWLVGSGGKIYTTQTGDSINPSWTSQTSGTSNWLAAVGFYGTNHGWAVGQSGTICTFNGTSWSAGTYSPTSLAGGFWNGIDVFDTNHVWLAGDHGTIAFWNGTSWSTQTSGATQNLNGITFTDINHGYAVGDNGTLVYTVNGGTNWYSVPTGTATNLLDVRQTDATHGWAVGESGHIFALSGTTLTAVASPTTNALYAVAVGDASHAWAVGAESGGVGTVVAYTVPVATTTSVKTNKSSIKKKKSITFSGKVSPSAAPGQVKVVLYRKSSGKFKPYAYAYVSVSGGSYSVKWKSNKTGTYHVVATYQGGSVGYTNYAQSTSSAKPFTVK